MSPSPRWLVRAFPAVAVLLLAATSGLAGTGAPSSVGAWMDDAALAAALAQHPEKVPVEFASRLQYVLPDGTLRVIGRVADRAPATEALVTAGTQALVWYSDAPAFLATMTPAQFRDLLAEPAILFLEPDYPLAYFTTESTLDVHARSRTGTGTGVWSWDGATSSFLSDVSGLSTATTGATTTVAVIDSGIDQTHKDFSATSCTPSAPYAACSSRVTLNVKPETYTAGFLSLYPSDQLPTTDLASGHGTHVSGIIAGNGWYSRNGWPVSVSGGDGKEFGMAPETNLVVVSNGDVMWAGLADAALDWVRLHHATYGIKVTSNSWGCIGGCAYNPASTTSYEVEALYDAGVVSVFAVGNDGGSGSGAEFSGYAQSPYVIAVAAHDRNDRVASFSSRGQSSGASNTLPTVTTWNPATATTASERRPDVAAPGVDIYAARSLTGGYASLVPRVNTADVPGAPSRSVSVPYVGMSGTSMATPHVTGAVALLFDACPAATPLQVMRAIFEGAGVVTLDKTGSTVDAEPFEVGYGKLDARASLDWLRAQLTTC